MTEAKFGIVANIAKDKMLRRGAKVWLLHIDGDGAKYPIVYGMHIGGRMIRKRVRDIHMVGYRAKRIPDRILPMFTPCMAMSQGQADGFATMMALRSAGIKDL